ALFITGTGLSREPSFGATVLAAELARAAGGTVYLDLDLRLDQWADRRAYGIVLRRVLSLVDVVVGTEAEVKAAAFLETDASIEPARVSSPRVTGDLACAIEMLLEAGTRALVVKRGPLGADVHLEGGNTVSAEPFKVDVLNVLGAGDGFSAGLIHARLKGW